MKHCGRALLLHCCLEAESSNLAAPCSFALWHRTLFVLLAAVDSRAQCINHSEVLCLAGWAFRGARGRSGIQGPEADMEERGADQEVQIPRAEWLQRNVHQHVQGQTLLSLRTMTSSGTVIAGHVTTI